MTDEFWMREALWEAQKSLQATSHASLNLRVEDVPVGALVVFQDQIVGRGYNRREADQDPTAHAEILALRAAARTLQTRFLDQATLYVTLEPCPMCAGAIWLARISRVVFGAFDPRAGACGSLFDIPRDPRLNHRPELRGGVLEKPCGGTSAHFFR